MFTSKNNSKVTPLTLPLPFSFARKTTSTSATPCSPKRSHMKHFTKETIQRIKTLLFFNYEDLDEKKLEDGRLTKYFWAKFQHLEIVIGILIIISFTFSVLQYEISYHNHHHTVSVILMFILNIATALIIWTLYVRHTVLIRLNKERRILSSRDDFFSTGLIYYFLLECLLILPNPNYYTDNLNIQIPSLNQSLALNYKANHLLSFYMNIRLILLVRVYLNCSIYGTSRSFRLCKIYGVEYGYMYTIRCLIKTHPLKYLSAVLISSMVVFAYLLKIVESPNETTSMDFTYYFNALWCVIITMTTTGYGDFYAQTPIGRAVSILIAFFGIFVVSLTVVSITNILELSKTEMKSMNLMLRLEERKALKSNAAKLLTSIAAFKTRKRKKVMTQSMINKILSRIKKYRNDFVENIRTNSK